MKDYSQYSYSELYGMLNHMNQFKYPDRVALLEQEIGQRVERGEVPDKLIPLSKINGSDILDFSLVIFSLGQLFGALGGFVFIALFTAAIFQGQVSIEGYIFILLEVIIFATFFYSAILLLRRKIWGVYFAFVIYIAQAIVLTVFDVFLQLNILNTVFETTSENPSLLDSGNYIPVGSLFFLMIIYFFIARVEKRKARDVASDISTFWYGDVFK